jgi:hypothetical protein
LLQAAERLERRLAVGGGAAPSAAEAAAEAASRNDLLLAGVMSRLEPAAAAAAAALAEAAGTGGGGDGSAVLGRLAAARAFLSPNFEQLFRGPQPAGQPTCVTKYLGIAAVGTAGGTTFVLLPGTPAQAGGKQPAAQQPPRFCLGRR